MATTWRQWSVMVIVAVVVLFTNLGGPRLWDRDEPRNAGCAAEMLERGDLVTPVFDGELRTHKPILLYWLMMAAYQLLGVSEFSARFWSAALGVGTACLTYVIGRRMFSPQVGFWAAIILVTTLMYDVASRAATPDSLLIFWSTAAICCFVWGIYPPVAQGQRAAGPARTFPRWRAAALMYGCMGMAVLAKGPVGLVLPTAVIGMFLLVFTLPLGQRLASDDGRRRVLDWLRAIVRPFAPAISWRPAGGCGLLRPSPLHWRWPFPGMRRWAGAPTASGYAVF